MHTQPPPLVPLEKPVPVSGAKFCTREEVTLVMKEKMFSWSGDDFKIKVPEFVMHYYI